MTSSVQSEQGKELPATVITKITDNFDHDEELLNKENNRFTVFPIKHESLWKVYKKMLEAFWKAEEIDFSSDKNDYNTLTKDEQTFVKMVLAFFAASDGIVNFNLRERFLKDVQVLEAQVVYGFQMMIENVHSEVYSLMLENSIDDKEEKDKLFNAIQTIPSIKAMADWAFKWIESTASFAFRLLAFAIIEGVFFSGAFASIFWLKKYRGQGRHFMNGLVKSNEFISRDEGMHVQFACMLYGMLKHRISSELVNSIMDEAVKISIKFTDEALQTKLIGMNQDLMEQYIKFIGDRLLVSLGYQKIYNTENPFDFMETIGMIRKTNFFEHRPTEYKSAHTSENKMVKKFKVLDDF
jgi:ribonucleoside-diphosphate reductase subunit M2